MSRVNKRSDAAGGQTKAAKSVWPTRALGDVCDVIGGGTPSKEIASYYGGAIPWATVRDMKADLIEKTECSITTDAVQASATNIIPAGNVIIATRVGLGKVCMLGQDTAINQDLRGIIPRNGNVKVKFLYHWLRYIAPRIVAEGSGATVQGVKLPFIKSLQMPLPTIPEQDRVVAILDEAFEGVATVRANEKRKLESARALFRSFLQSLFSKNESEWAQRRIGDHSLLEIVDGDRGKNYPSSGDFMDEGYCLFLSTKNVRPDGFKFDSTAFISLEKDAALRKGKLQRGDVVMTTRGTIGNIALYSEDVEYPNIRINSGMLIFRANRALILPAFLFELLRSDIVREQILRNTSGAAQPQLPIKTLVNFRLPMPDSLTEQRSIVLRARELEQEVARLEAVGEQKLTDLNDLELSILNQAFSGNL